MVRCTNLNKKQSMVLLVVELFIVAMEFGLICSQPPTQVMHASQCLTVFMEGSGSDVILH